ncbi:MAG: hypothetical protein IJ344_01750, partial [Clostridia bacterium]|nr:hypothetical protein [Clostridia bacterium]
ALAVGSTLLGFVVSFVLLYPSSKRIASELDALGMAERVTTMMEYRDSEDEMARMQRKDALECIAKAKPKQIRFHIKKKVWATCIVSLLLTAGMLMLPHNFFSFLFAQTSAQENEVDRIVQELIEDLREQLDKSELEDELKNELEEIVDDLEKELEQGGSALDQAGKLDETLDRIEDLFEKELSKNKIGLALQKYELTKPLGKSICDGELTDVANELDTLEEQLLHDKTLLKELSDTISEALTESGVDESDALYQAFDIFSADLLGVSSDSTQFEEELHEVFEKAKEAILAALEKQNAAQKEKEEIEEILNNAKDELLKTENEPSSESQAPAPSAPQQPGNESGSGDSAQPGQGGDPAPGPGNGPRPGPDGEGGEGGEGDSDGDGQQQGGDGKEDERLEVFYDPISGEVSYGKVFDAYYAEYLKALKTGEVPKELQEIMDRYFEALT